MIQNSCSCWISCSLSCFWSGTSIKPKGDLPKKFGKSRNSKNENFLGNFALKFRIVKALPRGSLLTCLGAVKDILVAPTCWELNAGFMRAHVGHGDLEAKIFAFPPTWGNSREGADVV